MQFQMQHDIHVGNRRRPIYICCSTTFAWRFFVYGISFDRWLDCLSSPIALKLIHLCCCRCCCCVAQRSTLVTSTQANLMDSRRHCFLTLHPKSINNIESIENSWYFASWRLAFLCIDEQLNDVENSTDAISVDAHVVVVAVWFIIAHCDMHFGSNIQIKCRLNWKTVVKRRSFG